MDAVSDSDLIFRRRSLRHASVISFAMGTAGKSIPPNEIRFLLMRWGDRRLRRSLPKIPGDHAIALVAHFIYLTF